MRRTSRLLQGGATLSVGQVVAQVCSFTRNIIIARLISPKDFGIAATFAVTVSVFDMISNISSDKLLIQAKDGDEKRFQNTAQLLHIGRGVMNATIIFLLGGPIASLFGEPQARWAFSLVALVPLLRGLAHLDTFRLQREMHFRPAVTMDAGSQVLVTLAALPLAFWLRDYTAMLWVLVLQAACATTISHLVAERPYGWNWEKHYVRRIASFGWPLLINGLLLFIIMDGDRFIIGSAHRLFPSSSLTLTDLGVYSVAFALAMAPTSFVANVSTSLLLPPLSRLQHLREAFEREYSIFAQGVGVVSGVIAVPLIVAGGPLVVLVYGSKYAAAAIFIGWLAAMWGLRMIRVTPTLAAMSLGDTRNSMWSNVGRTVALAGVLSAAALGGSLTSIAVFGFVGELLALGVCVWRLQREHAVAASICLRPSAVVGVGMLAAGIVSWAGAGHLGLILALATAAGLALAQTAGMLALFPDMRHSAVQALLHVRSGLAAEEISA